MFRKHPLRDLMLFLLLGITVTFAFNVQAVETTSPVSIQSSSFLSWQAAYQ